MVTATRRAQPLTQAPSAITFISAEEIRQSGATSIPELLGVVPGLDVFRLSAADARIAARGLNREFPVRMQVLLDGLSIQEDVRGFISWADIPVRLEEIERIEIVRSPATALYGDRAFAGVIHIITKSPEALKGSQVSVTVGEADTLIYNGIHAGVLRNFSYKVSGGYERFNQFPNPAIGQTGNEVEREDGWMHFQATYRLAEDSQISLSGGSLDFVKARYTRGDFSAQLAYHHANGEIQPERNISVFETFLTLALRDPPPTPQDFTIRVLGNSDLRPEEMLAYEVGYQGLFLERLRVRLELFYYQLDQLIDLRVLQRSQTGVAVQFVNGGDGASFGGEVGVEVFIAAWVKGLVNYSYQDRTGEIAALGFAPHHKANAGLSFTFPHGLSATILVHYVGEAKGVVDFTPPVARVDPYTLVNLRLGYRFKAFGTEAELAVQAFNLLNDVHQEFCGGERFRGGDLIERRVSGTMRYRF